MTGLFTVMPWGAPIMSVAEFAGTASVPPISPSFGTRLTRLAAPAISIAILAAAVFELHAMDWQAVLAMVPSNPLFWLAFILFYSTPIVAEWLIYRRIWGIPLSAMVAMVRKTVSNDLLFGYIGETYLYSWARRAGKAPGAAFGTVKDVALLSAAVGNSATILVALLTAPLLGRLHIGMPLWAIALAVVAVAAPPMVAIFGRKSVFHLPGKVLLAVTAIHSVRSATGILLTALLWHLALPEIALTWWVAFSALKLVLSRLPFISNKELVFAGTTAMLFGHHGNIATLMALLASLTVCAHIVAGLAISAGGVVEAVAARLRLVGTSGDAHAA
jgi:hypothetical protein